MARRYGSRMIERIESPDNVLAFRATGKIEKSST
jgi:hypothetical protein